MPASITFRDLEYKVGIEEANVVALKLYRIHVHSGLKFM